MTPQELMHRYPHIDQMMAETLLWAHERGELTLYLKDWPDPKPKPMGSEVVTGAVTVESPQEKSMAEEETA